LRDLPCKREHHGYRVLSGGDGVAPRGVHYDNALLRSRGYVYVVYARAGAPDDLEVLALFYYLCRDLCPAPERYAVILVDRGQEVFRCDLRVEDAFDAFRVI